MTGKERPTVVLLGASNIARSAGLAVASAEAKMGSPLDILAAYGHGRSYGDMVTRVLVRDLPGILNCGLWPQLEQRKAAAGLLTDIGNDLFYNVEVAQLTAWLEEIFSRLAEHVRRVVVTRLPTFNSSRISERGFLLMKQFFFPVCRLTKAEVNARGREVDEAVCRLAARFGFTVAEPLPLWYGLDPIHVKLRLYSVAWRHYMESWNDRSASLARFSFDRFQRTWLAAPEVRWLFGRRLERRQPGCRLAGGTRMWLY